MKEILAGHGEGLIVRRGADQWIPERVHDLLKLKPWYDGEATVIGYTTGDLTELGSKYLGMMGAVICRMEDGKVFKVSGFTDEERIEYWDNRDSLIGRTVEIMCDAVSQNQDGTYSLRFPRFVRFRDTLTGEKE
jgi:DNA ligase-1